MERVGLLVTLVGGFRVARLEGEVAEADPGEGGEFAVGLGRDDLFVMRFRHLLVARDVEEVRQGEKALRVTGMILEIGDETLQGGAGVFRLALVDLEIGLGEEGVAGGDGTGVVDDDPVERGDLALRRGRGVGGGRGEVLLLFDLRTHEDAAEGDRGDGDDREDLGPVPLDRVHDAGGLAGGEGVEIRDLLGGGGFLGRFGHDAWGWRGRTRAERPEL